MMNFAQIGMMLGVNRSEFPEYPGATVTTENISYASTNDPDLITLKSTLVYPSGKTNLPVLICIHGYHEQASDLNTVENNFTRWAQLGYFILAPEMRGSNGSSGSFDDGGRETRDVYEAIQYVITNHSDKIAPNRFSLLGFSGGGGISLLLAARYPDLFQACIDFFGISDYGSDATFGWYQQEPSRQAGLSTAIGGTPAAKPDEYSSRYSKSAIAINFKGHLSMFHDVDDTSVEVNHSQRVKTEYDTISRTDYYYNESNSGSPSRWTHAYPLSSNDLHDAEPLWKGRPKYTSVGIVPTSGTLKILGMLQTKRFTIYMNDGNFLNAGRSRIGTVLYDTVANTYQVTNDSANYAVVSIVTSSGLVVTGVLNSGETFTFEPVSILIDGNTPIVWFDAASKKLLSGSDVSVIADKTGGPQNQGYAWTHTGNRPALLATDINSLPAIEFISGSSEGMSSQRRRDLQNLGAFTYLDVGTGTIIDHGQSATQQTQLSALSGGSYFRAISNGSAASGSDTGTASYIVRSVLFDGSQTGNANRLKVRENKVQQTLSFSGTIPATNENNASSVFGIGKRSYSANYFTGKIAEFMIYNTALADIGDKEDLLKTKYAI